MPRPVLSVITPVYNCAEFIRRCYFILCQQSFTNWEWILVDDGSEDKTAELVQQISDERVRYYGYKPNRGRGYARTVALEKAIGDWVIIWDVDDLYFPDRLAQIEQARLKGYDFCCSYAALVNNELEVKDTRGFYYDETGTVKVFVHPTLACTLKLARQIGYDKNLRAGEDATMILTLAAEYNGLWIDDALTAYQEDREVNVSKAILSNRAQLSQSRNLYKAGVLKMNRFSYFLVLAKWILKLGVLNLFRLFPQLFSMTVSHRNQGEKAPGWSLSKDRIEFLKKMRQRHNVQDWSVSDLKDNKDRKLELV